MSRAGTQTSWGGEYPVFARSYPNHSRVGKVLQGRELRKAASPGAHYTLTAPDSSQGASSALSAPSTTRHIHPRASFLSHFYFKYRIFSVLFCFVFPSPFKEAVIAFLISFLRKAPELSSKLLIHLVPRDVYTDRQRYLTEICFLAELYFLLPSSGALWKQHGDVILHPTDLRLPSLLQTKPKSARNHSRKQRAKLYSTQSIQRQFIEHGGDELT